MADQETNRILSDQLTNVRLDIRELSTKMEGIKDLTRKVEEVHDTAKDALNSTKAAHKRLDELAETEGVARSALHEAEEAHQRIESLDLSVNKRIDQVEKEKNRRLEYLERIVFWVATTIIGSLILGGLAMMMKTKGV